MGIHLSRRVLTSDQALELDRAPTSTTVLGSGVEFAIRWLSFGAEVTIVEALARLIAAEDPWSSKQLEWAYRKRGSVCKSDTKIVSAKEAAGSVGAELCDGTIFDTDLLLVAVGRGPHTDGNGFEENGIGLDKGFVGTHERLRASMNGAYAVGDIMPGLALAHRGFQL
ncbi:FAD-dependent oxidoreductase [Rhodococcus sp. UFZ-B548]|uniref:FAD-dependent oxidoreductase n=1 Tax=Rhodococcus sp. UFZ-B548 TaxID=2742212 RepID=UPI0021752B56|nr:FAD-dependent oxidoreductase [Rhodococcus sp. UFZ-B548]